MSSGTTRAGIAVVQAVTPEKIATVKVAPIQTIGSDMVTNEEIMAELEAMRQEQDNYAVAILNIALATSLPPGFTTDEILSLAKRTVRGLRYPAEPQ